MWINYEKELNKRRYLRKKLTPQEGMLWGKLRNQQLGCKFRRQHSIGPYVADFYCHEKKLVIEIDGSQHMQTKEYDKQRDEFFASFGISVLRFWNNEINTNIEGVLMKITQFLETPHP